MPDSLVVNGKPGGNPIMTTQTTELTIEQAFSVMQPDTGLGTRGHPISGLSDGGARALATQMEILRQLKKAVRVLADGAGQAAEAASTHALWVEGTARTARDMVAEALAAAAIATESPARPGKAAAGTRCATLNRRDAQPDCEKTILSEAAQGIAQIGHQLDVMALQSSIDAARAEAAPAMWSAVLSQIERLNRTLNALGLPPDLRS
jgi:hypothetical protein